MPEPEPSPVPRWLRRPISVRLPWGDRTRERIAPVGDGLLRGSAAVAAVVIPLAMTVVGIAVAVGGALVEDRTDAEALGAFGVEAGAALWFGGAVTLGGRRGPTVLRAILLVAVAVGGAGLVVAAVALDWQGAALGLAMEFGVGMIAVAVIDVVILGVVHPRLEALARRPG